MATRTKKEQEEGTKKVTPAEKNVTSTRGYGKYDLKTGEFTYKPSKVGEPAKVNVKTEGKSEIYETTSKRKPMMVMTLKANKDSTDPIGDMYDDFVKLAAKRGESVPPLVGGRMLIDGDNIKMNIDDGERKVTCQLMMTYEEAQEPNKFLALFHRKVFSQLTINKKLFN